MYEELVKRLRDISSSDSKLKSNYIGLTMLQAAEAIEELSRQLAYYHGFDGFLMAHGMFGPCEYVPIEPTKEET